MVATLLNSRFFERCSFMMIIFTSCRVVLLKAGPLISYPEAYPNHHAHKWPKHARAPRTSSRNSQKFLVNEHNIIKVHIENHTRSIHTIIMMNMAWLIHGLIIIIIINIIIIGGST